MHFLVSQDLLVSHWNPVIRISQFTYHWHASWPTTNVAFSAHPCHQKCNLLHFWTAVALAHYVLKHWSLCTASRWMSEDMFDLLVVDVIGGLSTSHSLCDRLPFPKISRNNHSSLIYFSRILPWNQQDVEFMFLPLESGWAFVTSCTNRMRRKWG